MSVFDVGNITKITCSYFQKMGWGITFGYGRYFARKTIDMNPTMPEWYTIDNWGRIPAKHIFLKYDGGLNKLYSNFGIFDNITDPVVLEVTIEEIKRLYKIHSGIPLVENIY